MLDPLPETTSSTGLKVRRPWRLKLDAEGKVRDDFGLRPPDDDGPWEDVSRRRWGGYGYGTSGRMISPGRLGIRFDELPDVDWDAYAKGDAEQRSRLNELHRHQSSIASHSRRWRTRLLDWLAVFHREVPSTITIEEALIWIEEDPDIAPAGQYDPTKYVSLDTWRHAIYHASNDDDAPLELVLLTRAMEALFEWDHRQAVVDAVTACELVLRGVLERSLNAADERGLDIASIVLERISTFGQRLQLARRLGLWVPPPDDLVSVRNAVVHRGLTPNHKETKTAVKAAIDLVNHYPSDVDCQHPLPAVTVPETGVEP
jgi:hypothetical protein